MLFRSYTPGSGVSAAVYGDYLTFAFKNLDSANVIVEGTTNGIDYTGEQYAFSMNGGNEINPSVAVYKNAYYLMYTAPSTNHGMWTTHN